MKPLDMVNLTSLMEITRGRPGISVGLIDGPVAMNHPDLASTNMRGIPSKLAGMCAQAGGAACMHGTFVAGILCAGRDSQPRPSVPNVPCWCAPFSQIRHQRMVRCPAQLLENLQWLSSTASTRGCM